MPDSFPNLTPQLYSAIVAASQRQLPLSATGISDLTTQPNLQPDSVVVLPAPTDPNGSKGWVRLLQIETVSPSQTVGSRTANNPTDTPYRFVAVEGKWVDVAVQSGQIQYPTATESNRWHLFPNGQYTYIPVSETGAPLIPALHPVARATKLSVQKRLADPERGFHSARAEGYHAQVHVAHGAAPYHSVLDDRQSFEVLVARLEGMDTSSLQRLCIDNGVNSRPGFRDQLQDKMIQLLDRLLERYRNLTTYLRAAEDTPGLLNEYSEFTEDTRRMVHAFIQQQAPETEHYTPSWYGSVHPGNGRFGSVFQVVNPEVLTHEELSLVNKTLFESLSTTDLHRRTRYYLGAKKGVHHNYYSTKEIKKYDYSGSASQGVLAFTEEQAIELQNEFEEERKRLKEENPSFDKQRFTGLYRLRGLNVGAGSTYDMQESFTDIEWFTGQAAHVEQDIFAEMHIPNLGGPTEAQRREEIEYRLEQIHRAKAGTERRQQSRGQRKVGTRGQTEEGMLSELSDMRLSGRYRVGGGYVANIPAGFQLKSAVTHTTKGVRVVVPVEQYSFATAHPSVLVNGKTKTLQEYLTSLQSRPETPDPKSGTIKSIAIPRRLLPGIGGRATERDATQIVPLSTLQFLLGMTTQRYNPTTGQVVTKKTELEELSDLLSSARLLTKHQMEFRANPKDFRRRLAESKRNPKTAVAAKRLEGFVAQLHKEHYEFDPRTVVSNARAFGHVTGTEARITSWRKDNQLRLGSTADEVVALHTDDTQLGIVLDSYGEETRGKHGGLGIVASYLHDLTQESNTQQVTALQRMLAKAPDFDALLRGVAHQAMTSKNVLSKTPQELNTQTSIYDLYPTEDGEGNELNPFEVLADQHHGASEEAESFLDLIREADPLRRQKRARRRSWLAAQGKAERLGQPSPTFPSLHIPLVSSIREPFDTHGGIQGIPDAIVHAQEREIRLNRVADILARQDYLEDDIALAKLKVQNLFSNRHDPYGNYTAEALRAITRERIRGIRQVQHQLKNESRNVQRRLYGVVVHNGDLTLANPDDYQAALTARHGLPFFGTSPGDLRHILGQDPESLLRLGNRLGLRWVHTAMEADSQYWNPQEGVVLDDTLEPFHQGLISPAERDVITEIFRTGALRHQGFDRTGFPKARMGSVSPTEWEDDRYVAWWHIRQSPTGPAASTIPTTPPTVALDDLERRLDTDKEYRALFEAQLRKDKAVLVHAGQTAQVRGENVVFSDRTVKPIGPESTEGRPIRVSQLYKINKYGQEPIAPEGDALQLWHLSGDNYERYLTHNRETPLLGKKAIQRAITYYQNPNRRVVYLDTETTFDREIRSIGYLKVGATGKEIAQGEQYTEEFFAHQANKFLSTSQAGVTADELASAKALIRTPAEFESRFATKGFPFKAAQIATEEEQLVTLHQTLMKIVKRDDLVAAQNASFDAQVLIDRAKALAERATDVGRQKLLETLAQDFESIFQAHLIDIATLITLGMPERSATGLETVAAELFADVTKGDQTHTALEDNRLAARVVKHLVTEGQKIPKTTYRYEDGSGNSVPYRARYKDPHGNIREFSQPITSMNMDTTGWERVPIPESEYRPIEIPKPTLDSVSLSENAILVFQDKAKSPIAVSQILPIDPLHNRQQVQVVGHTLDPVAFAKGQIVRENPERDPEVLHTYNTGYSFALNLQQHKHVLVTEDELPGQRAALIAGMTRGTDDDAMRYVRYGISDRPHERDYDVLRGHIADAYNKTRPEARAQFVNNIISASLNQEVLTTGTRSLDFRNTTEKQASSLQSWLRDDPNGTIHDTLHRRALIRAAQVLEQRAKTVDKPFLDAVKPLLDAGTLLPEDYKQAAQGYQAILDRVLPLPTYQPRPETAITLESVRPADAANIRTKVDLSLADSGQVADTIATHLGRLGVTAEMLTNESHARRAVTALRQDLEQAGVTLAGRTNTVSDLAHQLITLATTHPESLGTTARAKDYLAVTDDTVDSLILPVFGRLTGTNDPTGAQISDALSRVALQKKTLDTAQSAAPWESVFDRVQAQQTLVDALHESAAQAPPERLLDMPLPDLRSGAEEQVRRGITRTLDAVAGWNRTPILIGAGVLGASAVFVAAAQRNGVDPSSAGASERAEDTIGDVTPDRVNDLLSQDLHHGSGQQAADQAYQKLKVTVSGTMFGPNRLSQEALQAISHDISRTLSSHLQADIDEANSEHDHRESQQDESRSAISQFFGRLLRRG